ncbi:MAG: hypothetical protein SOI28_02370 [Rahnella inusitata]|uniref:Uncharacterized protein n=1 Tax=Rahnella inusitata TaxID=58169 RepID=A0ABX9P3X2_9GAMM|nr:hypothetical protein [Rahnella inusitata]NMC25238.1 hypothetical protein [Serratia sp. (in: enterobacteria)]QUT14206.1 hypothetical protein I2123_16145 [Rahnella inusitata]RJT14993.1 hypothetical protein D5396_05925 [Rahnella inusitata]
MSEFTGVHREVLEDGSIKHVVIRDAAGKEQAIAAKDYISQGIQPELDELPEVGTDHEFPVSGKG